MDAWLRRSGGLSVFLFGSRVVSSSLSHEAYTLLRISKLLASSHFYSLVPRFHHPFILWTDTPLSSLSLSLSFSLLQLASRIEHLWRHFGGPGPTFGMGLVHGLLQAYVFIYLSRDMQDVLGILRLHLQFYTRLKTPAMTAAFQEMKRFSQQTASWALIPWKICKQFRVSRRCFQAPRSHHSPKPHLFVPPSKEKPLLQNS